MHKRKADIRLERNSIRIDTYLSASFFVNELTNNMCGKPRVFLDFLRFSVVSTIMHRRISGFAF